jgi:cell division protein FtsI/penicillin-binding protein 2
MKAVTMAAGVQSGVITPNSSVYDPGYVVVDGQTIYNFDHQGHGEETMTQVLQYSANVGAVWVAQRVGQPRFDATLAAFGFGALTGVDLPGESAGLLAQSASPAEAQLTLAENAFGESIGVTPLQLMMAYAALANGGLLLRPYIVASVALADGQGRTIAYGPHVVRRVVSAATAATVTQMLVDSALVSEAQMSLVSGYTVAAKTGTATPDPANPGLTYASVAGYAPASQPRVVLLVKLDHPRSTIYGGSAAGPLWRALIAQILRYYRVAQDRAQ